MILFLKVIQHFSDAKQKPRKPKKNELGQLPGGSLELFLKLLELLLGLLATRSRLLRESLLPWPSSPGSASPIVSYSLAYNHLAYAFF